MPAAAVIPAPIVYTNFVVVKKLVVGFRMAAVFGTSTVIVTGPRRPVFRIHRRTGSDGSGRRRSTANCCSESFTLKKIECSKQA